MEGVLGIGGYFMRAAGSVALAEYFGSRAQQTRLNFGVRVRDLDEMLEELRANRADVAEDTRDMAAVGRFGCVIDPEGNRVELWQPS